MFHIKTRQRCIDVAATLLCDVKKTTTIRRRSNVALRPTKSDLDATSLDVAETSRANWASISTNPNIIFDTLNEPKMFFYCYQWNKRRTSDLQFPSKSSKWLSSFIQSLCSFYWLHDNLISRKLTTNSKKPTYREKNFKKKKNDWELRHPAINDNPFV